MTPRFPSKRRLLVRLLPSTALLFLLALVPGTGAGAPTDSPVHHDLTVTLVPAKRKLEATDRILIEDPASHLVFSLNPDAHVGSLTLARKPADTPTASGTEEKIPGQPLPVPYSFEDGRIKVSVPEDMREGPVEVAIDYDIVFSDSAPENPVGMEDPTYGVTGTFSRGGVFLLPEAGWIPEPAESRPGYRVEIHAPKGMEAITAGALEAREETESGTRSVWRADSSLRGLALSAGPYVVSEARFGKIPVYGYFFPDSVSLAQSYLDASVRYLELYTGLLGPYPFPKFAVVENFFPTGYGFASYTLLGSAVIRLPFIIGSSLGHEVAHSWFGNGVLVDPKSGNWSEGLVTYIADYLYKERDSEAEAREYRLQVLRDYAALVPPEKDFPVSEFTGRTDPATRVVGYGKAAMIFHMIRRRVGDDTFWEGLRAIFREKLFQRASWGDFLDAFGVGGKPELADFEAEWLLRPGAPVLGIEGVKAEKDGDGWRVTGVVTQEEPVFRTLEVPVRVEAEAGETVDVSVSGGKKQDFEVKTRGRPLRVLVDPEADCFRRLAPGETPTTVNHIRGSDSLAVVLAASLSPEAREAAGLLLKALGQDDAMLIEEEDADPQKIAGSDLLVIGLPKRPGLLPDLPPGVILKGEQKTSGAPEKTATSRGESDRTKGVASQGPGGKTAASAEGAPGSTAAPAPAAPSFTVGGMTYSDPGDALFMTYPRKESEEKPQQDTGTSGAAEAGPGVPDKTEGSASPAPSAPPSASGTDTQIGERTVALFFPLSAEAAGAALRKIPHYGKQSLLVFSNGVNRVKSTWSATGIVWKIDTTASE